MKLERQSGIALVTAMIILLLVLTLVLGFTWLTLTDQQLGGVNAGVKSAFYGAEAGMEKLTADLGNLFATNAAPSAAQVHALHTPTNEPTIPFIAYLDPSGNPGYRIDFPPDPNGNPSSAIHTILSGPYQGMTGLLTPFTLTVVARSVGSGTTAEVKMQRQVQTVGIPIFQFGMFSQTDLSFFPGPDFNFGGRVHTNGNLWLAAGSNLWFADKITVAKEVVRQNLSNGWATSSGYTGNVYIQTAPGNYRPLALTEGSVSSGDPTQTWGPAPTFNTSWPDISDGTYNHYITNHLTGARNLDLSITLGGGAKPIDLVRRPVQGEDASSPAVLNQRFYAQAGVRILLSDVAQDIMALPCVDTSQQPVNLANVTAAQTGGVVPIAVSGSSASVGGTYSPNDGYWTAGQPPASAQPLITGFLKVEIQYPYATGTNPCGTFHDVTAEVLGLGIAGRNLNPAAYGTLPPTLPALPGVQLGPSACGDANPNAIIRFERVRDNPSGTYNNCGFDVGGNPSTQGTDYWPNVLFDTRQGTLRDNCPFGNCGTTSVMLNGVMHYVELDINNLSRWLTGAIGATGANAKDTSNSTYDFLVYFSDRRGNYTAAALPVWPPASPSTHETGEYGFEDFVNPQDPANGCPNGTLDAGETLDQAEDPTHQMIGGTLQTYGASIPPSVSGLLLSANPNPVVGTAIIANPACLVPGPPWPGWYAANGMEARENLPLFFRRALKIVHGNSINLGTCPNGLPCGLTIASENAIYVQGDFNALPNGNFGGAHVAAAVIGDALTMLSNNWNDVNSFSSPYRLNFRSAVTTTYRFAVIAGKGPSFPQPAGTAADFGTDGGVHNFLRYLENWGGQTIYYRGSIDSLYFNRQATGVFKCCATVYSPPTRGYNFDTEFLTPALLPPRTPLFRDINTLGFTQMILPTQ